VGFEKDVWLLLSCFRRWLMVTTAAAAAVKIDSIGVLVLDSSIRRPRPSKGERAKEEEFGFCSLLGLSCTCMRCFANGSTSAALLRCDLVACLYFWLLVSCLG